MKGCGAVATLARLSIFGFGFRCPEGERMTPEKPDRLSYHQAGRVAPRSPPMKKYLPLLLSILLVVGYAVAQYRISVRDNGGELVYGLDDAYIHMAIAKNWAEHGVWGVTKYEFTSSSSSLLWTLLLGVLFKLLGVVPLLPYILNVLFTALVLLLVDRLLRGPMPVWGYRLFALVAFLLLTPFMPLITTGMEHTLQIFITLGFAMCAVKVLANDNPSPRAGLAPWMYFSALFITFVRYDSAFLALTVCILLFLRRRWFQSVALGLIVLIPVAVYGWISVSHGWYFLPNSIILKSGLLESQAGGLIGTLASREGFFYWRLFENPHLSFLLALALMVYALRADSNAVWDERQTLLLLFVVTTILHMQFAQAGWFYRYEAYLMALGLVAVFAGIADFGPVLQRASLHNSRDLARGLAVFGVAVFLLVPALERGLTAWTLSPQAMNDRYIEHVIPARLIERFYGNEVVMVNDIGAPCFFSDAKILDIYGLGALEPVEFRHEPDGYGKEDLEAWARDEGAKVAIVQMGWGHITGRIPDSWVYVALWDVPRNVVFGDTEVGFFATSETEVERLTAALAEFFPEVPPEVVQSGFHLGDEHPEAPRPYPAARAEFQSRAGIR